MGFLNPSPVKALWTPALRQSSVGFGHPRFSCRHSHGLCVSVNLGGFCRSNCWHLRGVYSTRHEQQPVGPIPGAWLVSVCLPGCSAPWVSLPGSSSLLQGGQWGSRAIGAGFVLLTGSCCAMMIYVSSGNLLFMITRCADRIYLVQEFAFCNRA